MIASRGFFEIDDKFISKYNALSSLESFETQRAYSAGYLSAKLTSLEAAADYYGFTMVGMNGEDPNAGLSDGAIVAIIFGILILGFGGLVLYSRKK